MCSPLDYAFWECESRGGHLTPLSSDRFRVDRGTQTVFKFGDRVVVASTLNCNEACVVIRAKFNPNLYSYWFSSVMQVRRRYVWRKQHRLPIPAPGNIRMDEFAFAVVAQAADPHSGGP